MTVNIVMLNCFLTAKCVTNINNHSDSDLSLPLSQYATHTDFVSHIDKLMSNDPCYIVT